MGACPSCAKQIEGRVVFRDDKVFNLFLCPSCGQTETLMSNDVKAYQNAFLAKGTPPPDFEGNWHFKQTTSTCPKCLALLTADVVIRNNRVYFRKDCTRCGPSEALVSEDAEYYVRAYSYSRAGTQPLAYVQEAKLGCPTDCGHCGDHEQHTCLPIIEVTDHCNLECPICIVDNRYSTHMALDAFDRVIDNLIAREGTCESVALSGGEPTSHPQIMELIKRANRPEIGRVVLITNGLRLGKDRVLAQALKDAGTYIGLQLDGFSAETHEAIRGRDLTKEKQAALDIIAEFSLPTQLIFVATRGVNDHQVGQAVKLLFSADHFLSLNFQPVAYTGRGGGKFAHDPNDRLTIPGIIALMAEQTDGILRKSDFSPLPCSHPQCVSLTYMLRMNDGTYLPFARFVDFAKNGSLLRSSATLPASPEIHDALHEIIHDVFARESEIERGGDILAALRRTLDVMFPDRALTAQEAQRIGEVQAKSIFLHHYMDRHDFDLERLRKCCHHYATPDGKVMPACGYNMFHRGAATGADSGVPSWSSAAPHGAGTASARLLPVVK
jgi:7,8-dihydro-6-hydroxymethylpterin dimethyltransferase